MNKFYLISFSFFLIGIIIFGFGLKTKANYESPLNVCFEDDFGDYIIKTSNCESPFIKIGELQNNDDYILFINNNNFLFTNNNLFFETELYSLIIKYNSVTNKVYYYGGSIIDNEDTDLIFNLQNYSGTGLIINTTIEEPTTITTIENIPKKVQDYGLSIIFLLYTIFLYVFPFYMGFHNVKFLFFKTKLGKN